MSFQKRLSTVLLVGLFLVAGCNPSAPVGNTNSGNDNGGNGNDNAGEFDEILPEVVDPYAVAGSVALPAGVSVEPTALRVSNGYGEAAVNADSSYSIESIVNLAGLSVVVDEQDRAILLGFVSPDGSHVLNSKSTAVVLIYFAIGGWTLPAERVPELVAALEASAACDSLADVIEVELAGDATALQADNAAIREALLQSATQAVTELRADATSKVSQGLGRKRDDRPRQQSGTGGQFLTIDAGSSARYSGVTLTEIDDDSVRVTNHQVRHGCFYVFQSAYEDAEGARIEISPVEQLGDVVDVPPARNLDSSRRLSEILDSLNSAPEPVVWVPGTAGPVPVEARDGALSTELTMVLLGPRLDESSEPSILSEPAYVLHFDEWESKLEEMQVNALVLDFLVPLLETTSMGVNAGLFAEESPAVFSLEQLIGAVATDVGLSIDTTAGFLGVLERTIAQAAENEPFRLSLIDAMVDAYASRSGPPLNSSRLAAQLQRISEATSVREAIEMYGQFDVARRLGDLQGASSATVWTGEMSSFRLDPRVDYVTLDERSVFFEVLVADGLGDGLTYEWSTGSGPGELMGEDVDGNLVDGQSFTSSVNEVEYFVADQASIVDGFLDTVSVTVRSGDELLGTSSAEVFGERDDEDDDDDPPGQSECEGLPLASPRSSPFFDVTMPERVRAGDRMEITITINAGAIEAYALSPVSLSLSSMAISKVTQTAFTNGEVLLDGEPLNYNHGNYAIYVSFATDGVTSHTISAPIDESAHQYGCGLTNEVQVILGGFPNRAELPGSDERSFHDDFFVDPPLNEE